MKYTWLVEKYLEGELSGEALRKFELEILTKPEVAKEVERVRSLTRFMKEQHHRMVDYAGLIEDFDDLENIVHEEIIRTELEELKVRKISSEKKHLDEFRIRVAESQVNETLNRYRSNKVLVKKVSIWIAASSIAVLFAVSSLLLIGNNSPDYSELYNNYFSPRYADVSRTTPEDDTDPFINGLKAYNDGDHILAYQLLSTIPEDEVSNLYYLYLGISALEIRKFQTAIDCFNKLGHDANLRHEGMWYKSLCYLKMQDEKAAREALEEIIEKEGYYETMARNLLRKL